MEKVQRYLNTQPKKATRRMAKAAPEEVGEEAAENKTVREVVLKKSSDDELLAEMRRRGLVK
jgi:hypothetical protein